MRRPAHGATRRPPLARPGNGYGRAVRPRPTASWRALDQLEPLRGWDPAELLVINLNTTTDDTSVNV